MIVTKNMRPSISIEAIFVLFEISMTVVVAKLLLVHLVQIQYNMQILIKIR